MGSNVAKNPLKISNQKTNSMANADPWAVIASLISPSPTPGLNIDRCIKWNNTHVGLKPQRYLSVIEGDKRQKRA